MVFHQWENIGDNWGAIKSGVQMGSPNALA